MSVARNRKSEGRAGPGGRDDVSAVREVERGRGMSPEQVDTQPQPPGTVFLWPPHKYPLEAVDVPLYGKTLLVGVSKRRSRDGEMFPDYQGGP